jgi:hypothetical protein
MRLQKYKVKVNHGIKDVVFQNEDEMEKFMDKFGFEPGEQPLYIQQYCVGISDQFKATLKAINSKRPIQMDQFKGINSKRN